MVLLDVPRGAAACSQSTFESTKHEPHQAILSTSVTCLGWSVTIIVRWQLTIRLVAVVIAPL